MCQWLRIEPEDGWLSGTEDIALDSDIPPSHTHTCTGKHEYAKKGGLQNLTSFTEQRKYSVPTLKSVLLTCSKTKAGVRDWKKKKNQGCVINISTPRPRHLTQTNSSNKLQHQCKLTRQPHCEQNCASPKMTTHFLYVRKQGQSPACGQSTAVAGQSNYSHLMRLTSFTVD